MAVIFEVEVSVMRWRLPSCLRNGVVRLDVGEFGGIWCLTWLVEGVESEIRFVGGCCEGAGPFGGWVLVFGGYGVGGVRSRGPPGVWIRVLLLFSPGQSICKSLVRGWGAYRGGKASPWLGPSPLDKMTFSHLGRFDPSRFFPCFPTCDGGHWGE